MFQRRGRRRTVGIHRLGGSGIWSCKRNSGGIKYLRQGFIAEADAMNRKKKVPRQRCTICRKWYRPDPRTLQLQKTCGGEKCRRRRRRVMARRRRERDLHVYRVEERQRQRARRSRKAGEEGVVSRAVLSPEVIELKREILEIWDKSQRLSRAELRRQLVRMLGDTAESWDKVGQKRGDVTRRVDSLSP